MSARRPSLKGFTLIELLVVIAIIAVLISVLMPALSAARSQGQRGACMANLRAITRTATMYAHDDPADIIGPIHKEAPRFRFEGYAEYGGGPGDMPYQAWDDPFDPRTRQFNWLIYGGPQAIVKNTAPGDRGVYKLFQCPGDDHGWQEWYGIGPDEHDPRETERSYYWGNGTAYRMNNLYWEVGSEIQTVGIYGRSVSKVPNTSLVVSFMEARAEQTTRTNDQWGIWDHGELTGWHTKLGYFNLAYVDGHVAYADMGFGAFYPHSDLYNDQDMRGTWGNMDCFPADAIPEP
ncbi:MAG: type II secretion system protein [Planctomycetota bacterium]